MERKQQTGSPSRASAVGSAKEQVIAFIRDLPDDCTIEEIRHHLYVYSRAPEGLRAFEAGLLVMQNPPPGARDPAGRPEPEGPPEWKPGGEGPRPQALYRPDLTEEEILAWADAHRAREGQWPR